MFGLLKKIKSIIMKKEGLEQQANDAIAVAQRLNEEIKQLRADNERLISESNQLREDFNSAVERVRYLDGQVKMLEAQNQAKTQYSDNNRNY
jgi:FtsZ-binding cell division protein ZapB